MVKNTEKNIVKKWNENILLKDLSHSVCIASKYIKYYSSLYTFKLQLPIDWYNLISNGYVH